jgi:SRSO17 transposase
MIRKEEAEGLCKNWGEDYEQMFESVGSCFSRSESRDKAKAYLRGLMSDVKRKNGWQLSERLGMRSPLGLQRLLNEAKWDEAELMRLTRGLLIEASEDDELGAVGVVDESGFVKKGDHSAGVKRQYCGRIGKVENCQVGVFLTLVTESLQGFLDRRLYLPQDWCEDETRCEDARIPQAARSFKTKPELALEMLQEACSEGVELSWVTGDTLYGNSPSFRQGVAEQGCNYVLAIGMNHKLKYKGRQQRIDHLLKKLSPTAWSLSTTRATEQGLLKEQWACLRVDFAGQDQWLIFRRSKQGIEVYLSNAADTTDESLLIKVILARHAIEHCLQEAKSELGLADYEVRYFHAWLRHITLCFLAHCFLTLCRQKHRQKKLPTPICKS